MPSLWTPPAYTPINDNDSLDEDVEEHHDLLQGHTAVKFLLSGGIAGAGKHALAYMEPGAHPFQFRVLARLHSIVSKSF